jgi:hypothetical protein
VSVWDSCDHNQPENPKNPCTEFCDKSLKDRFQIWNYTKKCVCLLVGVVFTMGN